MAETRKAPLLLFATPRTGSWPVYEIILEYLKQTREVEGLREPFNTICYSLDRSGGRIVMHDFPQYITTEDRLRTYDSPGAAEMHSRIVDQRLDLILNEPGKYFFKFFPNQVDSKHFALLNQYYEMIYLEREDLWDQLLSYLISLQTNQWYEDGGIRWEERSIRAARVLFDDFERVLMKYYWCRKQRKPQRLLTYEQFLKLGPEGVLSALGLCEPIDISRLVLPAKQNPPGKERAFTNLDELRTWFDESTLPVLRGTRTR